jgi:RimK family alpha-L-glutamate ligase
LKTLGICSSRIIEGKTSPDNLGYESRCLFYEAKKVYDNVFLIDPMRVSYDYLKKAKMPDITYNNTQLNNLSTLIVRSTSGCEKPIALLARTLYYCGCDLIDPLKRFNGLSAGKMFDPLKEFAKSILPETSIVFNEKTAKQMIERIALKKGFPVIAKPEKGSKGEKVCLLNNKAEALKYINDFYTGKFSGSALLFQKYINVKDEFRAFIIGGKLIGLVKKLDINGKISRNAAQGGVFIKVKDNEVVRFILKNVNTRGIVGVDAVRDHHDKLFILESNRSPQWKSFEKATNINVAERIIEYACKRVSDKFTI